VDRAKAQRFLWEYADRRIEFQFLGCTGKSLLDPSQGPGLRITNFSHQVLPIDEYEKAKLLPIRSVRLRLKLVAHWIDQLNSNW
jgi:hypothetical protein